VLAVQIGDLAVVASYTAKWSIMGGTREGRRAADLVVGGTVQARIDGSKLVFVIPNGSTISASIVRQQLVADGATVSLPESVATSESANDANTRAQQDLREKQRCFQRQQMEHGLGGPVPNAALC
jgi:secreted protein with Ig-like and vWFA domain